MKVIGVVGGIASGKSFVSKQLERMGGIRLNVDRLGHEVLELPNVRSEIAERWGESMFVGGDVRGLVDRSALAGRVFGQSDSASELAKLEAITHPHIGTAIRNRLQDLAEQAETPAVILDAAVLFKAGWDKYCDTILFVDASDEVRRLRAEARGWSRDQWERRERSQTPIDEKKNRSDVVIDNSSSRDETIRQLQVFWQTHCVF